MMSKSVRDNLPSAFSAFDQSSIGSGESFDSPCALVLSRVLLLYLLEFLVKSNSSQTFCLRCGQDRPENGGKQQPYREETQSLDE